MLKKAYVEITNRCNLACSFCPKTKRAPRTMSAQEFDLILSRLEGYVQYVYLHVMGEPLLHPELTTLFALAKARNMKICITTNGTLLQKRSSELLAAESLHKISVSLHSFEGNDGADARNGEILDFLRSRTGDNWPEMRNGSFLLRDQLGVLVDGTVVPCCLDHEGDMALGNLFTQPLTKILNSPRACALREGFSRRKPAEELCRRCGFAARFNK